LGFYACSEFPIGMHGVNPFFSVELSFNQNLFNLDTL